MSKDFKALIKFVKFTLLVQKVKRVVLVQNEDAWENDSEHSFQLAIVAWYLIQKGKLKINLEKVLLLSLAHDLVEVYAGDTYIYAKPEVLAGKEAREKKALDQIKKEFPDFPSLYDLIHEYEERKTSESRFVYALDKLLPILDIYLDGGRIWQQKRITLDRLLKAKTAKIALAPDLAPYYEELVVILKDKRTQLFPKL